MVLHQLDRRFQLGDCKMEINHHHPDDKAMAIQIAEALTDYVRNQNQIFQVLEILENRRHLLRRAHRPIQEFLRVLNF